MNRILILVFSLLIIYGQVWGAEVYPAKPVRIIIGFPPGGLADLMARIIAPKLGSQFLVENRGIGAAGIIAVRMVKKSDPDGYTLLATPLTSLTSAPSLQGQALQGLDPLAGLSPIALHARSPMVLVVHPSLPVKSVKELIALAKARPGELDFGGTGVGLAPHLAGVLFGIMSGVQITHVPYKGTSQAVTDLIGGRIALFFSPGAPVQPFITSGRLRAIAVTGTKRSHALPDLPTISESGLPGYEMEGSHGFFAPERTPREVVDFLHRKIVLVLQSEEVIKKWGEIGVYMSPMSPVEVGEFVRKQEKSYTKLIEKIGLKPE